MVKMIKEKSAPGAPIKGMIPLSIPEIRGNEWVYVKECLDTGWVSSVGSYVDRFEAVVAKYVGARHAVACASGTAALHTALLVAGIGPGDEVILPALTFAAPAFAVRYTGAWPVFVDIDPNYWQIDIGRIEEFLVGECRRVRGKLINTRTKRTVKAILPVHLLGHPVDMDAVMALARKFGLVVIEDAAESIGAEYKGRKVGSHADMACFSFNGNKIVTCGGGGMLTTGNKYFAERARFLTTQAKEDPVEYIHHEVGYNYRMTNVQAAIGLAQMERLDEFVGRKRNFASVYASRLKDIPGIGLAREASWARATCWLYTILVDKKIFRMSSRDLMRGLAAAGIQSRPLWHPLHSLKAFKGSYTASARVAERVYDQALSVPSSTGMTSQEQDRVIRAICDVRASKRS
ncbi:MAG: LegC family aminotransferase [Candidatus Omnitrophica bacterium]|nr:LegC family aminotransferase [Candidatus Omnitrophota bacterium]